MRTTVRLNNNLLERAKEAAANRNITLTALLEEGLRLALARREQPSERVRVTLPVCNAVGGVLPGVNLDDSAALLDAMESRR